MYVHIVFICSSVKGNCIASTLGLLWILLLLTWEYKYLFETLLWILLRIYPEVEMLGQMINLLLIFWGITILFSIVGALSYTPTKSAHVLIFPHLCQHLFSGFCFLILALLMDVKCIGHLILNLNCLSFLSFHFLSFIFTISVRKDRKKVLLVYTRESPLWNLKRNWFLKVIFYH